MAVILVRGRVDPRKVTSPTPKSSEICLDDQCLRTLRDLASFPEKLRAWYQELGSAGRKKVNNQLVLMAREIQDEQTRAFDIMTALLEGGFTLPKSMMRLVCGAALRYPFTTSVMSKKANKILQGISPSSTSSAGLFMPPRPK
jgi:hypothetical protein